MTRQGRSFRNVFIVFGALLVVGLIAGFIVYRKYVAYEPRVAAHVPADARAAARFDLTHVMLYEPFRRSIFPLVDRFGGTARSRRERLEAQAIRVNSDVRELLAVLGPSAGDWALVVGGRLPRGLAARGLAAVLRDEGRQVKEEGDAYVLTEAGLTFAEASDGVLAIASSREMLAAVLPAGTPNPDLAQGSGGVLVRAGTLPPPFGPLSATFRSGSVVEVRGHAAFSGDAGAAEPLLRLLLQGYAGSDPNVATALQGLELSRDATGIAFRLGLPREAVLGLIEALAQRVPG